jgi:hypothetical protein
MPSTTDESTSKAPGHGQVGRYLPAGMGLSGISGIFYLADKRVPWWGLLLWGTFALVVVLVQSVIPQNSQDKRRVIETLIVSRLATKPRFDRAQDQDPSAHRASPHEEEIS